MEINIRTWFTSTRTYNTEHATVQVFGDVGVESDGAYKWMNRSWQSYDYCTALCSALKGMEASEENIEHVRNECHSVYDAKAYLEKNLALRVPYKKIWLPYDQWIKEAK